MPLTHWTSFNGPLIVQVSGSLHQGDEYFPGIIVEQKLHVVGSILHTKYKNNVTNISENRNVKFNIFDENGQPRKCWFSGVRGFTSG